MYTKVQRRRGDQGEHGRSYDDIRHNERSSPHAPPGGFFPPAFFAGEKSGQQRNEQVQKNIRLLHSQNIKAALAAKIC